MSADTATTAPTPPKEAVESVRKFVAAHGGSAEAVLQAVGRRGVRVTLIGADGVLGDHMVADAGVAHTLLDAVDGVSPAAGWERELVSKATPRTGHWAKMAGWVAGQTRFPKARNEK